MGVFFDNDKTLANPDDGLHMSYTTAYRIMLTLGFVEQALALQDECVCSIKAHELLRSLDAWKEWNSGVSLTPRLQGILDNLRYLSQDALEDNPEAMIYCA